MKNINGYEYRPQSEFWEFFLEQDDASSLLKYDVPAKIRNDLFKKYVSVVNIETSSYCNRMCSYCPVVDLEKKTKEYIGEDSFNSTLKVLSGIDYRGIFTLNLFNEPLAAANDFIKRVGEVRAACPSSFIRMNSNGDYLTKALLSDLIEAGLSEMLVTLHVKGDEKYDDIAQLNKMKALMLKLGLEEHAELMNHEENRNITFEINVLGCRILLVSNNWSIYGNDRGGSLEMPDTKIRKTPCVVPFREVVVDYTGDVVICWNVFRDSKSAIGRISERSIVDIYFDRPAVDLRREMFTFGEKAGIHKTCNVPSFAKDQSNDKRIKLLEL